MIETIINYLIDNKEWLFSGIGVLLVTKLLDLFLKETLENRGVDWPENLLESILIGAAVMGVIGVVIWGGVNGDVTFVTQGFIVGAVAGVSFSSLMNLMGEGPGCLTPFGLGFIGGCVGLLLGGLTEPIARAIFIIVICMIFGTAVGWFAKEVST